ncbi:MAG TPA: hypothetical protein VGK73_07750 [Polyangiaceae bacterium]
MSRANEPAYPAELDSFNKGLSGLTVREAFAMAAMQGLLAAESEADGFYQPDKLAHAAVVRADALLAELAKPVQS